MSITHIPFYPSDWLAGTRGMTAEETGVYITLIARMYEMAGPIERDDERLYRICGCKSKRTFQKVALYLISEGKIEESKGQLFNQRVQKEIKKVVEKSTKAKDAAEARWGKKPNKINISDNADAMRMDMRETCYPKPKPEPYKKDTNVSQKDGLFDEVEMPKAKAPKKSRMVEGWTPSQKNIEDAYSEHLTDADIQEIANDFQIYWADRTDKSASKSQRGWDQAWRNRCRDVAPKIIRNRRMAGNQSANGYGQSGGLAGAYARRHLGG